MRSLLFLLVFIQGTLLIAQNGKSQRLYQKAESAIKSRNLKLGKELYQKSINADVTYANAYLRLAALYNMYRVKDSALIYYEGFAKVTPTHKINSKIWLRIANLNYQLGNYSRALSAMEKLRPFGDRTESMERLENNINFALREITESKPLDIEELPPAINQFQLQYFPVMTVDGQSIFFTKRNGNSRQFDEDIFSSQLIDGQWTQASSISENINTSFNEGACTISADGRTLIFTACEGDRKIFGSCDLFISEKIGEEWSVPETLGPTINSKHWDSQPSISGDGKIIYFSSDRPGGFGKRDIWMSTYSAGIWNKPVNLGRKINSSFDETTPFIHVNNQSFFYSSTGFDNMGGFDLFISVKDKNSGWSYPKNLGYPINTYQDELSLFINAKGTKTYYSVEDNIGAETNSKLMSFNLRNNTLLAPATYVTGVIRDRETKRPLRASLEMINLLDSTDTYLTTSDSISGRYFLVLTEGNGFGVFIDKKNYLFEDIRFTPTSSDAVKPDTLDIFLSPLMTGQSVILENIYFSFDDYALNEKSMSELKSIVRFMKNNSEIKVLIEGHTDKKGDDQYNQKLSEDRAEAVYNYLVNRGIGRDRLFFEGFGSARPLIQGVEDDNRRIEFRLL
jgi:outer membrane protein OmpA-like peptidoglycan-associated protein